MVSNLELFLLSDETLHYIAWIHADLSIGESCTEENLIRNLFFLQAPEKTNQQLHRSNRFTRVQRQQPSFVQIDSWMSQWSLRWSRSCIGSALKFTQDTIQWLASWKGVNYSILRKETTPAPTWSTGQSNDSRRANIDYCTHPIKAYRVARPMHLVPWFFHSI